MRKTLLAGASVVVLMLSTFGGTAHAGHDGLTPSNCLQTGSGAGSYGWEKKEIPDNWYRLCHLGRNGNKYQNNAAMVVMVQRILRYAGKDPGPYNDGKFGPQTEAAVRRYQDSTGHIPVTSGVVDTDTWYHMSYEKMEFLSETSSYAYFYIKGGPKTRQLRIQKFGYWLHQIRTPNNDGWMYMDTRDM